MCRRSAPSGSTEPQESRAPVRATAIVAALVAATFVVLGFFELINRRENLMVPGFWPFMGEVITSPAIAAAAAVLAAVLVWDQSQRKRQDDKREANRKREDEQATEKASQWWRSLESVTRLESKDRPLPEAPLEVLKSQLDPSKDAERVKLVDHLLSLSTESVQAKNRELETALEAARTEARAAGAQAQRHAAFLQDRKSRRNSLHFELMQLQNRFDAWTGKLTLADAAAAEARSAVDVDDYNPGQANYEAMQLERQAEEVRAQRDEIERQLNDRTMELEALDELIPQLEAMDSESSPASGAGAHA